MNTPASSRTRDRLWRGFGPAVVAAWLVASLCTPAFGESLSEAAERVAREHDARLVSAREIDRNGRTVYVIRILTRDGVVRTIRVRAREDR